MNSGSVKTFLLLACAVLAPLPNSGATPEAPPNVVLIVADDMGYADFGAQGARGFKTPHLDRLAAEGTRFTHFYVAQAVCTASRAGFLSGCYPNRIGLQGALNHTSRDGIHEDEWLLPEMLKERGYATAGAGKWHLGTRMKFHPLRNGFDEWLGIPYSNDNSKFHPSLAAVMPPLPLYDGEKVIELDPDQSRFTKRFTERAVQFIERNAARPFFVYLPHVMPHVPIFASEPFKGRSAAGLYGDVMEELDWSVGEILATLMRLNLDGRTLVIFMSDNGPFLSYGEHAGSAAPLREGKLTVFEGGVRVPCLMRWPGRVPQGRVSDVPFMAIDLPADDHGTRRRESAGPENGRPLRQRPLARRTRRAGAARGHVFLLRHRPAGRAQRPLEAALCASLHYRRGRAGPGRKAVEFRQPRAHFHHPVGRGGDRHPARLPRRAA